MPEQSVYLVQGQHGMYETTFWPVRVFVDREQADGLVAALTEQVAELLPIWDEALEFLCGGDEDHRYDRHHERREAGEFWPALDPDAPQDDNPNDCLEYRVIEVPFGAPASGEGVLDAS